MKGLRELILLVALCAGVNAKGLKATSEALARSHSSKLAQGNEATKVAEGITKTANSLSLKVQGVEKAVNKAALETTQARQQELANTLHKDQLSTDNNVAKMKASVHAAAMIKKAAISHTSSLPSAERTAKTESKSAPASDGQRGRTVTIHDPAWFKAGPYAIMALLISILCTFCYCACSSRPTAMSGKYDMH